MNDSSPVKISEENKHYYQTGHNTILFRFNEPPDLPVTFDLFRKTLKPVGSLRLDRQTLGVRQSVKTQSIRLVFLLKFRRDILTFVRFIVV